MLRAFKFQYTKRQNLWLPQDPPRTPPPLFLSFSLSFISRSHVATPHTPRAATLQAARRRTPPILHSLPRAWVSSLLSVSFNYMTYILGIFARILHEPQDSHPRHAPSPLLPGKNGTDPVRQCQS